MAILLKGGIHILKRIFGGIIAILCVSTIANASTLDTKEFNKDDIVFCRCIGEYTITAYCPCNICCGEWSQDRPNGIVYGASGEELQEGVSVASPLPFGTVIEIEGIGERVVQDRTADYIAEKYNNKVIDIYFNSHEAAEKFGKLQKKIYIKEEL